MKSLIMVLVVIAFPLHLFALGEVDYKLTIGSILMPTLASEIVIDKNNGGYTLLNYEGKAGVEVIFSVLIDNLELSYVIQNYSGVKNTISETGDIKFEIETVDATLYWDDPRKNAGLNLGVGIGKGIGNITVNKSSVISNGVAFVKEYHINLSALYHMSSSSVITLKYGAQVLHTVTGKPFSNSLGFLTYSYQF